jgi:hypothetical protein
MHKSKAQENKQLNATNSSNLFQDTTADPKVAPELGHELGCRLETFLHAVASDSVKVDMLCYLTRLATTGYQRLDDHRLSTLGEPWQPQVEWLAELPAAGYHAASFPSIQELAIGLSYSGHRVL